MKKKLGAILFTLALIFALAACSGNADDTPNEDPPATEAAEATEPEIVEEVESAEMLEAYQTYLQMMDRLFPEHGAIDLDLTMSITVVVNDETSVSSTSGNLKMILDDGGEQMSLFLDLSQHGVVGIVEAYMAVIDDETNFMRISINDDVFETEFTYADMYGYIADVFGIMMSYVDFFSMATIDFDAVVSAEIEESAIQIVFDEYTFIAFIIGNVFLESVMDGFIDSFAGLEIRFDSAQTLLTIVTDDNGDPSAMSVLMPLDVDISGNQIIKYIALDFVINARNGDVMIESPR